MAQHTRRTLSTVYPRFESMRSTLGIQGRRLCPMAFPTSNLMPVSAQRPFDLAQSNSKSSIVKTNSRPSRLARLFVLPYSAVRKSVSTAGMPNSAASRRCSILALLADLPSGCHLFLWTKYQARLRLCTLGGRGYQVSRRVGSMWNNHSRNCPRTYALRYATY